MASLPAYSPYVRRPVPQWTGNIEADYAGLLRYLGVELGGVKTSQRPWNEKTITANYTTTVMDDVLLVDATASAVTVTFPDPTRAEGGQWIVKKIDSSGHAVTFAATILSSGAAATFDGAASPTLPTQWKTKIVRSDGNQYYILASF